MEVHDFIYSKNLVTGGLLLLSGFYKHDQQDLLAEGQRHGLAKQSQDERDSWASLVLKKTA